MNELQKRIQASVERVIAGKLKMPGKGFMCLAGSRIVIEDALGWKSHALYDHVATFRVNTAKRDPWAADLRHSLEKRGWVAKGKPQAGDIVFGADPKPEEHVGIVYQDAQGKLWVLENTTETRRGERIIAGPNKLTPLEHWDRITLIGRLPLSLLLPSTTVIRPAPAAPAAPKPAPAAETLPRVFIRDPRTKRNRVWDGKELTVTARITRYPDGAVQIDELPGGAK